MSLDDDIRFDAKKAAVRKQMVISVKQLRGMAQPQAFLIDNAIPRGGITFISGLPGVGKSWLAYDLVLAVARKRSWLGRAFVDDASPGAGCLVLNYDNPTPTMAQRFIQLQTADDDPIYFHTRRPDDASESAYEIKFPCKDDADARERIESIKAMVAELEPRLVLIDSFRQAHEGEENSSKEVAFVLTHVKRLLGYGTTVVIIHHSAKDGGRLRGTGEIEASADCHIQVVAHPDDESMMLAKWEKHRGWPMKMGDSVVACSVDDEVDAQSLKITKVSLR